MVSSVEKTFSQVSYGGAPHSSVMSYPKNEYIKMLSVNKEELRHIETYRPDDKNAPFQFAYPIGVDLNPSNSGKWDFLKN